MRRELSDESVRHQAEAFVLWSCRLHDCAPWRSHFDRWTRMKDFAAPDAAAIWAEVVEMLKLRGVA